MVCHCLLIEAPDGLVLVDTGLGLGDIADRRRLGRGFLGFARPRLDPAEAAATQVGRLGFRPSDVRHILCTHLDVDHAGALPDFPDALVHVWEPEVGAVEARATLLDRERYKVQHFAHGPKWRRYEATRGEPWFGFQAVQPAHGLPPEILIIPLAGHTRGHTGIAVRSDAGWLLHAGDAYFSAREMVDGSCPPGLSLFQRTAEFDRKARLENQARLRELSKAGEVRVFCAHDPDELASA
jgi:glyoxylase-like metal-dependent hydrolase (beta-lactamase superfamily II)